MNSSHELIKILTDITDPEEMAQLLDEILTPKEISDLSLRWQLLKDLHQGKTQRSIAAEHHISLCKITRGSKILKKEGSVTLKLLNHFYGGGKKNR